MNDRVREVAVVGRDAAAWTAALGLRLALGRAGLRVRVVELPSALQPADVYAAPPSLGALHRLLGLPEQALFKACRAVPVLGQRFAGWNADGSAFVHAYDIERPTINDIDFLQFWVKARRAGLRMPLEDFSLAAVAAKLGRISVEAGGVESLTGFRPGYHLDARRYARLLRQAALHAGVERVTGALAELEREGDRIASVVLDGGERIEADLFVDASGADAVLIRETSGAEVISWSRWLPADCIVAGYAPPLRPLPGQSLITAFADGWAGLFPLQDRTALFGAVRRGGRTDGEVVAAAARACGAPVEGAVVRPFSAGVREQAWTGNCVAIGDAAVQLEPLDAMQLQPVQIGLSNLITHFPADRRDMPEARSFNEAMVLNLANIRDFQIAHYQLSGRSEPFWQDARAAEPPPTLASKLGLFASRGLVPRHDGESFQQQSWSAAFVGHGMLPRSHDPAVDTVSAEEQVAKFQRLLQVIGEEVDRMPTVDDYVAAELQAG